MKEPCAKHQQDLTTTEELLHIAKEIQNQTGRRSVPPGQMIAFFEYFGVGVHDAILVWTLLIRKIIWRKGQRSGTCCGQCTSSSATPRPKKDDLWLGLLRRLPLIPRHGASTSGHWSLPFLILKAKWWVLIKMNHNWIFWFNYWTTFCYVSQISFDDRKLRKDQDSHLSVDCTYCRI